MPRTALELKKRSALESNDSIELSDSPLTVADLPYWIEQWLLDGECRLQSARTQETRRVFLKNFLWFLQQRRMPVCGVAEVRLFFAYLSHGHKEPGGRWGSL